MTISPYLAELRAKVGQRLLVLPSASVLVDDPTGQDRVLLVRHADSKQWGVIGGMIEPEEEPAEAAVREAEEETGLQVEVVSLLTAIGGPDFTIRYPNGDLTSYVTVVYRVRIIGGQEHPDGVEVDQLRWFDRHELATADLGTFARALLPMFGAL